jgi:hypothetical protein
MTSPTDKTQEAQAEVQPLALVNEAMMLEYAARAEEDNESTPDAQWCHDKYMQAAELYEKAFVLLLTPNDRLWSNVGIRLTQSYAAAAYYLNDDEGGYCEALASEVVKTLDTRAALAAFVLFSSSRFVTEARLNLLSWLQHGNRRGAERLRVTLVCWLTAQIAESTMTMTELGRGVGSKNPWKQAKSLVYLAKLNTVLADVADTEPERIAARAEVLRILTDLNELQQEESLRASS